MAPGRTSERERWHRARFKFKWPEAAEAMTQLDLLVAHTVVRPLVQAHDINLWRVHRRWKEDDTAHVFSFCFYGSSEVGESVIGAINADDVLAQLRGGGFVMDIKFEDGGHELASEADPEWRPPIRAAWPFYIHGVSQMWLSLIASQLDGVSCETVDKALLERFREADEAISLLWSNHGYHALLHHLNAIFGYVPWPICALPLLRPTANGDW